MTPDFNRIEPSANEERKPMMSVHELVKETRELQRKLDARSHKAWTVDAWVVELMSEAGTLADSVMIEEGYRHRRPHQGPPDIGDDLADIMFLLVGIADHYHIDLEQAYRRMIRTTEDKLAMAPVTAAAGAAAGE